MSDPEVTDKDLCAIQFSPDESIGVRETVYMGSRVYFVYQIYNNAAQIFSSHTDAYAALLSFAELYKKVV